MNPEELLLRDIHLPDPVSWWPPAIGWWLLALLVIGISVAAAWWRRRLLIKHHAPATLAHRELVRLRMAWADHRDTQRLVSDISTWLRRSGMSLSSRHRAASPTGDRWRRCLDELAGEPVFDNENGALITTAPYRAGSAQVDGERLLELCERWLSVTTRATARKAPRA